jgi:hypothetical protein
VRSQATKSYRQLLVRVLPPLVIRAFGAHFKFLRFQMTVNIVTEAVGGLRALRRVVFGFVMKLL